MNNTAHFGLTSNGRFVNLGVGADNSDVANNLANSAESVARFNGEVIEIVTLLTISDLYRLKGEFTDALNNLDNEALGW